MFAAPNFFQTGGGVPVYMSDVFSAFTYTGNGSTKTITNGIDLAGKGGLVWIKSRGLANNNALFDTSRGATNFLISNSTAQNQTSATSLTSFNADGFSIGSSSGANTNGDPVASWSFRKQPKFFDVVTYTGNGTTGRQIAHNLGSVPGCMIVKRTDVGGNDWAVYHRGIASPALYLNLTAANNPGDSQYVWGNGSTTVDPTSTVFTVAASSMVNANGGTYVAYLFAHNAGGFGSTGTDNAISCGGYTGNGGSLDINLGYQPQFVIVKRTDTLYSWQMYDTSRGFNSSDAALLAPNLSDAESTITGSQIYPTSTGFTVTSSFANTGGGTYVYIAIRANS